MEQPADPVEPDYVIVEQRETERLMSYDGVRLHLSWGTSSVRLYREGTTPWVWDAVIAARRKTGAVPAPALD